MTDSISESHSTIQEVTRQAAEYGVENQATEFGTKNKNRTLGHVRTDVGDEKTRKKEGTRAVSVTIQTSEELLSYFFV